MDENQILERAAIASGIAAAREGGFLPETTEDATPEAVLANVFRTILRDNGVTASDFKRLIDDHLQKQRIPSQGASSPDARSNWVKDIWATRMSWGVFLKNLKAILNAVAFDIQFTIYYKNKPPSHHKNTVYFDQEAVQIVERHNAKQPTTSSASGIDPLPGPHSHPDSNA